MFRKDDVNRGNFEETPKRIKDPPGDYVYTARMGEVYAFIDVKTSPDLDPFTDPPDGDVPPDYRFTIDANKTYPHGKWAWYRVLALGQSTRYAHVVQTCKFRTCVYSISVAGTTARLLRWDRSGVVVTESFDYKSSPKILAGFIWRFSTATHEQCGFDLSAIAVDSKEDREQFIGAIRRHVEEQLPELAAEDIRTEVDKHYSPGAIARLTVGTGAEAHSIWVSRPMFTSKGAAGRSTRGYWGVECKSGEVIFVKDVWRADAPGVETEGAILKELSEAGVRNIPGLVCHGDVLCAGRSPPFRFT